LSHEQSVDGAISMLVRLKTKKVIVAWQLTASMATAESQNDAPSNFRWQHQRFAPFVAIRGNSELAGQR
jgi:hypothetical protein